MKKLLQILACVAVIGSMTIACSKDPGGDNPTGGNQEPLATPELSLSRQTGSSVRVSWNVVENAAMYAYEVDGKGANTAENYVDVSGLTVDVPATIRVRAISSNAKKYSDSEWAEITYTPSWFTQTVALSEGQTMQDCAYNSIEFTWAGSDVKSVKYMFFLTEMVEGSTDADIQSFVATDGLDVPADLVEAINDGGADLKFNYLQSGTSYTIAAFATNKSNAVKFVRSEITTAESELGNVPTDGYKTYLGTYELSCTDSWVLRQGASDLENAGPQTFRIKLTPSVINASYWFTWGIDDKGFFDDLKFSGICAQDYSFVGLAAGEQLAEIDGSAVLTSVTWATITEQGTDKSEFVLWAGLGDESYGGYLVYENGSYSIVFDEGEATDKGVKYNVVVNGFSIASQQGQQLGIYYDVIIPQGPFTVTKIEEQAAPALKSIERPLILNKEFKKRASLSSVMEVAPMARKINLK